MKMNVVFLEYLVLSGIFLLQVAVDAGPCNSETLGDTSVSSNDRDTDGLSSTQYVLTDSEYKSDCCGVVTSWGIYANQAGTILFEVWRPNGDGSYTLVGQNSETVSASGEHSYSISSGNRIIIQEDDVIGWYTSGPTIIKHRTGGRREDNNYYITGTSASSVGNSISPVNDYDERTYAIYARLGTGNTPAFSNLDNSVSLYKNSISTATAIYTVTATDDDIGDTLSISLLSISPSSDFALDTASGDITPTTTSLTIGDYTITVRATDVCGNTADGTLTVTVINRSPVINSLPSVVDVSETATDETLLHTVNVTDTDGDPITCSISSSPSGPFLTKYVYDNGELFTAAYLQSSPNLNYDLTSAYTLTVTCSDNNGAFDAQILYVYITQNNVPVITNLQNVTSITSSVASNTEIFQVLATDAEGDQTYFSVTCVIANPCPFTIYSTGAIFLSKSLVRTTTNAYELDITVFDDYSSSGAHRLTVFVTDLNTVPELINLPASIQVNEDTSVGTILFTVSIYDEDGDTSHTFTSIYSPSAGNALFSLNSATGEVTLIKALNYLTQDKSYSVTIDASDAQSTSNQSYLSIDIIDVNTAPVLLQTFYLIESGEGSAGTALPDPGFNVYDRDGDNLTYAFAGGNSTNGFNINASTGIISFAIDYDIDDGSLSTLLEWLIKIYDPEGLAVTATLTVSISDNNDNTPLLSSTGYSATTYSDVSLGTTVLTVSATDDDVTNINTQLEYNVQSTQLFGVDQGGHIFVHGSLINYGNTVQTFTVRVSNPNINTYDSASVSIYIAEPSKDSFFDNGANIAWVTILCIMVACAIPALAYLGYRAWQHGGFAAFKSSNVKQVAPYDTAMPNSAGRERPQSHGSTVVSTRTMVTPSDVRVIRGQWNAWTNDSWF